MRVLFTSIVGYGVFFPMVPLARTLVAAGHDVAIATGEMFCPWARRLGFDAYPAGIGGATLVRATNRRFPAYRQAGPTEWLERYLVDMCASVAAPAMAEDLMPLVEWWRPDVIVHDPSEFAAVLAATRASIPNVTHSWGPCLPFSELAAASSVLAALWQRWGQQLDVATEAVLPDLYLDICPPSLQLSDRPPFHRVQQIRPEPVHIPLGAQDLREPEPQPWLEACPDRPTVYVTLGTVFNRVRTFDVIIEALANQPINVLVAVGQSNDPARFAGVASNIWVARHLPQQRLLPFCDLVICQAGPSTVLAALGEGVPLVTLPQGIDHLLVAEQCQAAAVGLSLEPAQFHTQTLLRAVEDVLADSKFHDRAQGVKREIAGMPRPEDGVQAIVETVAGDTRF